MGLLVSGRTIEHQIIDNKHRVSRNMYKNCTGVVSVAPLSSVYVRRSYVHVYLLHMSLRYMYEIHPCVRTRRIFSTFCCRFCLDYLIMM